MLQSSQYHHTPLLVLAAAPPSESNESSSKPHPPVQVAEWLNLIHLQHPWQVHTYTGIG